MERKVGKMRSESVYNEWDNMVYVRSNGDLLHIICNKEEQMDAVNERFYGTGNELIGYEEWDEGEDKRWIMVWKVPSEFVAPLQYN